MCYKEIILILSLIIVAGVELNAYIAGFNTRPMGFRRLNKLSTHDHSKTVFCNIEINGESIEAVGFDMDFTLARYNKEFDQLSFQVAKEKLVSKFKYPKEILSFKYCAERFRRGLLIDKRCGNVLKIDRHKYIRKVFHGVTPLGESNKRQFYPNNLASFPDDYFDNIDTIFQLIDAVLFTYLVDYSDRHPQALNKTYSQIYKDVREAIESCHHDGSIKDTVMKTPEKYIIYDEDLMQMLLRLKATGKKVFLLTNSLWEYTNSVMSYLLNSGSNNDNDNDIPSTTSSTNSDIANNVKGHWWDWFDVVIVGASKPSFFTNSEAPMFQLDVHGQMKIVKDKTKLVPSVLAKGNKLYQGGSWLDLHNMLNISYGDRLLYVGDHMYADVVRSKRKLGWRTCLIIPELTEELEVAESQLSSLKELLKLKRIQYDYDEHYDDLLAAYQAGAETFPANNNNNKDDNSRSDSSSSDSNSTNNDIVISEGLFREVEYRIEELKRLINDKTEEYDRKFNPYWGQLFKADYDDSRFSQQVTDYACLYTSKASNLAYVSLNRPFRPIQDFMPHDYQTMLEAVKKDKRNSNSKSSEEEIVQ